MPRYCEICNTARAVEFYRATLLPLWLHDAALIICALGLLAAAGYCFRRAFQAYRQSRSKSDARTRKTKNLRTVQDFMSAYQKSKSEAGKSDVHVIQRNPRGAKKAAGIQNPNSS